MNRNDGKCCDCNDKIQGSISTKTLRLKGRLQPFRGVSDIKLLRQWGEEYDDNTALSAGLGVDLDERLRALKRAVEGIDVSKSFIDIDIEGDTLIALGETKKVTCRVVSVIGVDFTEDVSRWQVERISSNATADESWAARDKQKAFNALSHVKEAVLMLTWSNDPSENDLDPDVKQSSTSYKFTAYFANGNEPISETLTI